jgi:hypothetical protein
MADAAIRDRSEFAELLGAAMANTYAELSENQRLLYGQNLVKTYLLELDARKGDDSWLQAIAAIGFDLTPSDDSRLVTAIYGDGAPLILDRVESRFVIVHSLAAADRADAAVHRLSSSRSFDNVWLSAELLERIATMGALRGFTTRFDRSLFHERRPHSFRPLELAPPEPEVSPLSDLLVDETLPVESLKLRLWGSEATSVLQILRNALRPAIAVAGVRIRYFAQDAELFSLDELDYTGRMTTRGNSYEVHRNLAQRILDRYRKRLETIERTNRIRFTKSGGITGDPLSIRFAEPIDPWQIADVLVAGTQPFRFVGVPRALETDYVVIPAVDLHGGHSVDFEISPDFMRVYLRDGGCANAVLRLESNLQRHLDATAHIAGLQ